MCEPAPPANHLGAAAHSSDVCFTPERWGNRPVACGRPQFPNNVTLESTYEVGSSLQTAWCVPRTTGACAADHAVVRPCGPRRHHRPEPSHVSRKAEHRRHASGAARPSSNRWRWRQLLPNLRVDFPGLELFRVRTAKIAGAGPIRTNNTFHQNRSRNFHAAVHRLPITRSTSRLNLRSSLSSALPALCCSERPAMRARLARHLT
jgi:hypothetical protein